MGIFICFVFYQTTVDLKCCVLCVEQNDSDIHVYIYIYFFFFGLFSFTGYYKILSIVPCAITVRPCWLSVLYIVVCMLIPKF